MRVIKLGLISVAILFIIVTLISLLFPSHIRISKAINLPNKRDSIFALLKKEMFIRPVTDSASFPVNQFQKKIIEQTDSTLVVQLQQNGKKPVKSGWQLYGTSSSDSLTLQWYMDFQLSWYPWEKFTSLFFENTYGRMMEAGLADVKRRLTQ